MKMNKLTKIKILTLMILLSQSIYTQNTNWKQDLNEYAFQLESKHIDLYNKISKKDFQNALRKINVISKTENDFNVILELMKLTRQIGDGHTAVSLRNMDTHSYPFEIKYIENEWRVVKVITEHKNLLRSSLVAINGVPIDEVVAKISEVAQFVENEYSKVVRTGDYLTISELLYALNITKEPHSAIFKFQEDNNQNIEIRFNALDKKEASNPENFAELAIGVSQVIKPESPRFDYLWYVPIKNTKALYINFKSYPTFEDMQVFGEELVGFISENKIKQVVIDMRNNGGGDLYVGVVLAYALNLADTIDWNHGVYVMTDAVTFSAATSNSALFKQLLNAKIVGQPTGSNPTGYQDMGQFELPNSKLVITYSKRKFNLSKTIAQGIQPDVLLKHHWSDYQKGIDNMLQWIIKDIE
jgi:hypothetical protein